MNKLRIGFAIGIAFLAAVGTTGVRASDDPAEHDEPLVIGVHHPERQGAEILRLFEGSRAASPAAALSAWKRSVGNGGRIGKPLEAVIAMFNPEMVREARVLDGTEIQLGFEPAAGSPRWFAIIPHDDGTVASALTAARLSYPDDEPVREAGGETAVARLSGSGSALATQIGSRVILASSRAELIRGIRAVPIASNSLAFRPGLPTRSGATGESSGQLDLRSSHCRGDSLDGMPQTGRKARHPGWLPQARNDDNAPAARGPSCPGNPASGHRAEMAGTSARFRRHGVPINRGRSNPGELGPRVRPGRSRRAGRSFSRRRRSITESDESHGRRGRGQARGRSPAAFARHLRLRLGGSSRAGAPLGRTPRVARRRRTACEPTGRGFPAETGFALRRSSDSQGITSRSGARGAGGPRRIGRAETTGARPGPDVDSLAARSRCDHDLG